MRFFNQSKIILKSYYYKKIDSIKRWWFLKLVNADTYLQERSIDALAEDTERKVLEDKIVKADVSYRHSRTYETEYIVEQCLKYGIALPRWDDSKYYHEWGPNMRHLTESGKEELLGKINQVKQKRLENIHTIMMALAPLLSLFVALIALISK